MERPDDIDPMVPELPSDGPGDVMADGGLARRRRRPSFDDPEADAPLVPDLT